MIRQMKDSGIEWIGKIPSHWKITKCKYISKFINGFAFDSKDFVSEYQYPIIRIGDITNGSIDFKNCLGVNDNEGLDDYRIQENDILLAMSGATVGKVGLSTNKCNAYINQRVGIIRSNVFKYLFYNLQTSKFIEYILLQASGSAQPNVSGTVYGEFTIPFPPFPEQEAISDFLDKQCSEIDSVIERTKATIEEYKKLKQSIITEAVTKGIRGDRPMKDSGIEWIGDIPARWDIKVAFQLFSQVKNKNEGLVEQNLLSLSYGKIKRKSIDAVGGLLPENFDGYNIIEKDDIVLRLTDLQNDHTSLRVGLSNERGIVTSAYVTLRNQSDNTPLYLYYYLHSFDLCKGFYGMGAGVRQGLNWEGLKLLKIALPPIDEQKEITDFLEKKCAEIDALVTKKEQIVVELEAYKKSLIYEVVTGKRSV